jgi:hypothetical protein
MPLDVEGPRPERAVGAAGRELRQVHLREDHRPGITQPLDHERVVGRNRSVQQHRSAGGREIERIEVVLQHDGDAVQRRPPALGLPLGVQRARLLERLRVERDDRVQAGALFVVGLDPRQAQLHEPFARHRPGFHRRGELLDRRRVQFQRLRGHAGRRREHHSKGNYESSHSSAFHAECKPGPS